MRQERFAGTPITIHCSLDLSNVWTSSLVREGFVQTNFALTNQPVKDGKPGLRTDADIVDFATLTRFEQLGGKGCATKVRVGAAGEVFNVFKGIDFRTFLTYCDNGEDGSDDNAVKLLIEN